MEPRSALAMIAMLVILIATHGGEIMAKVSAPVVSEPGRYTDIACVGNPGTVNTTYTNGCS